MGQIARIRAFNRFYTNQIGLLDRVGLKDLSLTEARAIYEIGSRTETNARELASYLGLDEGYFSRVIKSLERCNLIRRSPSPNDARVFQINLTPTGVKEYARLVKFAGQAVEEMISGLPDASLQQMLEAMNTVEGILSCSSDLTPEVREIETGDIGWVIKRHGELYAATEGFDTTFEALVARIVSEFVESANRPAENGWIATSAGLRLGCVFVVADDDSTARLRLMLVEPFARGQGVGQLLISRAIDHARNQEFEKMVLWTQESFVAARRLYEQNGFQLKDSTPNKLFGKDVVDQTWECAL